MNPDLLLALLCFFGGLAFGFVRLLLAGKVSPFWIDVLSFMAGALVLLSRSILGIKI